MKKYSFKIGMQLKGVAQEAIRTKNDLISLLLRAVQYMHFGEPCPEGTEDSFTIEIEKISRISFFLIKHADCIMPQSILSRHDTAGLSSA